MRGHYLGWTVRVKFKGTFLSISANVSVSDGASHPGWSVGLLSSYLCARSCAAMGGQDGLISAICKKRNRLADQVRFSCAATVGGCTKKL